MKVLHVILDISRRSGGPSRSVQGLVAGLNAFGIETWLLSIKHGDEPWVEGVTHFINGVPFESVLQEVKPNIVHLHGIWSLALHRCASACRHVNIPYVIAPRGMLEPWSLQQKWLKKRIARWLYQDRDLRSSAALHATAESEAEQFRRLGLMNQVIVSPNGLNVPKELLDDSRRHVCSGDKKKRVLFVSRMHPKKGVLELVEAWNRLVVGGQATTFSAWCCELVYTVGGELEKKYEAKIKAKVKELGLEDRFVFTGALDDEQKWKAYARADLFVLPTYSENFGIVVAEALWDSVPVITTKGTPWQSLDEYKCGWWIDIGVAPLADTLFKAMSLTDDERYSMGERGHRLVEEKYSWDVAVKKVVEGYGRIVTH